MKKQKDYYKGDTGRKTIDFLIGFFIPIVLNAIFGGISSAPSLTTSFFVIFLLGFNFLFLILYAGLIFLFFKIKRKWIAFGILAFYALLFLFLLVLFGACLLNPPSFP